MELNKVSFRDSMNGIAVGLWGTLLRTSNGGNTWEDLLQSVTRKDLNGMYVLDQNNVWMAGNEGVLLHTTNGGNVWTPMPSGVTSGLSDIYFVNSRNGWTVGATILRTTDGGLNWTQQSSPPVRRPWRDLEFGFHPVGWIVGGDVLSDGRLLKTIDGGNTWNEVTTISLPGSVREIQFTSPHIGWIMAGNAVAGTAQRVYKTTDGGGRWEVVLSHNSDTAFLAMNFVTDRLGWVSTFQYFIYRTQDGGDTWQTFPVPHFLNSISFLDSLNGWGGSSNGEIYRTTDGGTTWLTQFSPMGGPVRKVKFFSKSYGWALGSLGGILHTSNGGISFAEEHVGSMSFLPQRFLLQQNYPNPFNSETLINIDLHVSVDVMVIEIFDILGRSVRSISAQPLQGGRNTFRWDGRDDAGRSVASGVFLYRVRVDGQVEVRKMILIR